MKSQFAMENVFNGMCCKVFLQNTAFSLPKGNCMHQTRSDQTAVSLENLFPARLAGRGWSEGSLQLRKLLQIHRPLQDASCCCSAWLEPCWAGRLSRRQRGGRFGNPTLTLDLRTLLSLWAFNTSGASPIWCTRMAEVMLDKFFYT